MTKSVSATAALMVLTLTGCSTYPAATPVDPAMPVTSATADLRNAAGLNMGTATITQLGNGLRLTVTAMNLSSGGHGFHIHQTGVCTPPDFSSAGGHWNPTGQQHGKDNPAGMHRGDLPNLLTGTDGRGSLEYMIPGATLSGGSNSLFDGDGAALVIHARADDYHTDPSGNSGDRIACGVFRPGTL